MGWPGSPDTRPRTDAEDALRQVRRRQLVRLLVPLLALALGSYLWATERLLQPLLDVPPLLRPWALSAAHALAIAYPWAKLAAQARAAGESSRHACHEHAAGWWDGRQ